MRKLPVLIKCTVTDLPGPITPLAYPSLSGPPDGVVESCGLLGKFAGGPVRFPTTLSVCEMNIEVFLIVSVVPGAKPKACENCCCVYPPRFACQCESWTTPRPSDGSSSLTVPVAFGPTAVMVRSGIPGSAKEVVFELVPP